MVTPEAIVSVPPVTYTVPNVADVLTHRAEFGPL
jgi:hypothetical protein